MKKNIEKQYNYYDCILNLSLIFPAKKTQTNKENKDNPWGIQQNVLCNPPCLIERIKGSVSVHKKKIFSGN